MQSEAVAVAPHRDNVMSMRQQDALFETSWMCTILICVSTRFLYGFSCVLNSHETHAAGMSTLDSLALAC